MKALLLALLLPAVGALTAAAAPDALFDNSSGSGAPEPPRLLFIARPPSAPYATRAPRIGHSIVPVQYGSQTDACSNLASKAARLRRAADACDADVASGRLRSCQVKIVTFSIPGTPSLVSPDEARSLADELQSAAEAGDGYRCQGLGGEGIAAPPDPSSTVGRSDRYYGVMCSYGDDYACQARQISQLCFDQSETNNCVRTCLLDEEAGKCHNIYWGNERMDCRKRAHWKCYEEVCHKYAPTPLEMKCISRFPGWWKFLLLPRLGQDNP